jgi:hypothetical protein
MIAVDRARLEPATLEVADAPPEQAKNMADNSRATKGGQMIRYRHVT